MSSSPTFILHQAPNERWIQQMNQVLSEAGWGGRRGYTTGLSTAEGSVEGWLSADKPQLLVVADRGNLEGTGRWVAELKHEAVHLRAALVGAEKWPPGWLGNIPTPFDYYISLTEDSHSSTGYGSATMLARFLDDEFPWTPPGIDGHLEFLREQAALRKCP